jgi:hypothetical protein
MLLVCLSILEAQCNDDLSFWLFSFMTIRQRFGASGF